MAGSLFVKLFIAFIAATIIGTITHELGHYLVAKSFGYPASINYASTHWEPSSICSCCGQFANCPYTLPIVNCLL